MPLYRWPTDPPGKPPAHTMPYSQHQANERARFVGQQYQASGQQALQAWNAGIAARTAPGQPGFPAAVPPAPSPAAPPPPEPPPAPRQFVPDSIYNDTVGINKRRFEQGSEALDTDERNAKYQYGFDDATNPFNRVNEMKRDFLNRGRGITTSLAARGQLYSGYHARALANNARNEAEASASLRQAYDAVLDDIRRRRGSLKTDREEADLGAYREGMARQGL